MTSQLFSSFAHFEKTVIADLGKNAARPYSAEIYQKIVGIINDAIGGKKLSRHLVSYIRLAIKLNPYGPEIPTLLKLHDQALKTILTQTMPELTDILRVARENSLPLPVIVSCEKYLSKARALQKQFKERYFSITPLIIRGDPTLTGEKFEVPVLSLPVADSYEALPVKMLESFVLLHAADEKCGMLKIDDDLKLKPLTLDPKQMTPIFAAADYIGTPVQSLFNNRTWHFGKCSQPAPAVYGKPSKSTWARGALYYLSPHALEKLAQHYMRFPGCLDGEIYEDKAVGDILFDNNIILAQYALEHLLGLDSSVQ